MRGESEAARAVALGAPRERVFVTGNTKFDALVDLSDKGIAAKVREAFAIPGGAPVWVAGSTHAGEERDLVAVAGRLLAAVPDLRVIVAPRYVERCPRVAARARSAGIAVGFRSRPDPAARFILLDTMGELAEVYRLGTVAFVGGSFVRRGGQNVLEPAARGVPVLYGPHMENFEDAVEVLQGRGGIRVDGFGALETNLRRLLADPEKASELGNMGREAVRGIAGASRKNVELIEGILNRRARG
jgi:3-deoxy-D-manno-octulosonic-acid transferase